MSIMVVASYFSLGLGIIMGVFLAAKRVNFWGRAGNALRAGLTSAFKFNLVLLTGELIGSFVSHRKLPENMVSKYLFSTSVSATSLFCVILGGAIATCFIGLWRSRTACNTIGAGTFNMLARFRWLVPKKDRIIFDLCIADLVRQRKEMLSQGLNPHYAWFCIIIEWLRCAGPIVFDELSKLLKRVAEMVETIRKIARSK